MIFVRRANAIEDATGVTVDTYRAPGFSLTQESLWALDILAEEAVKVDCSVFPAVARAHGGLPKFTSDRTMRIKTLEGYALKEIPLNTRSILGNKFVFSGGVFPIITILVA